MILKTAQPLALFLYAAALPLSLSATNIVLGIIVLLGLIHIYSRKENLEIPTSFLFLFLFFTWALFTQSLSTGFFELRHLNAYGKIWNFLPLLFIPILRELTEDNILISLKTLLITASLVAFLGSLQYWWGVRFFFEGWFNVGSLVENRRFYGFQSYPLHTAALFTILFSVALNLLIVPNRPWREKWIYGALFLFITLAVLITGARSYYLGMLAAIIMSAVFRGWKILVPILLFTLLGITLVAKLEPYVGERFKTINPREMDESGRQRLYAWRSALNMIADHPLRGVGYKNWKETLPQYAQRIPNWKMDPSIKGHAHNSILTITAETGIPGLGFILCFWFFFLKEELETLKSRRANTLPHTLSLITLSASVSVLVASCFEHNFFTAMVVLPLFFIAGLSRLSDKLSAA